MDSVPEKKLLLNLKEGDASAFEEVFFRYNQRIFNFCLRFIRSNDEVEEIVQRVFVALWEQRDTINPEKSVSSYLFGIAKNLVYQEFRKKVYREAALRKMEKKEDVHEESAYQEIFFGELKEILHSVVEQLPSRQKEIYLLSREHGLSYFEIATRLGISENTVDTQLRRALSFIREKYRQHYNK